MTMTASRQLKQIRDKEVNHIQKRKQWLQRVMNVWEKVVII